MGNYTVAQLLDPHHTARAAAKNTFTTFADISPSPNPQNGSQELKLGTKVRIEAWGEYSCATGITLALGVWYSSAAAATAWMMNAFTTGTTPTAWPWHLVWNGLVTAVGSTTTSMSVDGIGVADIGSSLTQYNQGQAFPATAAARLVASLDGTVSKPWGVGAQWGTSGSGNTITCYGLNVELLNQGKT